MSARMVHRLVLAEVNVSALPDDRPYAVPLDEYYTKQRVIDLLKLYPYLSDSRPPRDPEMDPIVKRNFSPSGWREEAATKRADIYSALLWLEKRSVEAQYVVRAYYCVGLSFHKIAPYMRERFRPMSDDTIERLGKDGVQLMSDFLCGLAR